MTATEAQVAAAMEALISEGGSPGNSIHSWRCEHPDMYGSCDCAAEAAKAIANAVVAAGPDPAKVAAEALVWRDRGQIIHDQQTRITQLERECLDREATETDARSRLATAQANCTCRSAT